MSRSAPQALLLVDGYNIVGAWSDLKVVRDRDGLEIARRALVESLVSYSAYQNYDTRVVFDAQYQDTPGCREIITQNISICYTDFRQTADTYIEKTCALFRHDLRKFEQRLIVATSDRAQQLTVVGYGAEWMSAQELQREVKATTQQVRGKQKSKQRSSNRFLFSGLDPIAQERLARMRMGLGAEES